MSRRKIIAGSQIHRIEWLDARVSVDGLPADLPIMTSYGIVIYKDKTKVCICSLFGENDEPRIVQAIPSSLVRNVKRLR